MKISLAVFKLSSLFKIFDIIPYQLLLLSCIDCVCTYIFKYNFILLLIVFSNTEIQAIKCISR